MRRPVSSRTKIGPVSRIQESSIARSSTSTPPVTAARASATSAGRATSVTGSKAAIALTTVA
jgi:hypothetical protein